MRSPRQFAAYILLSASTLLAIIAVGPIPSTQALTSTNTSTLPSTFPGIDGTIQSVPPPSQTDTSTIDVICPPIEQPSADGKKSVAPPEPVPLGPTVGNAPAGPATKSIQSIGSGDLFSSAKIFTFKAPDVVTTSHLADRTQLITFVVNVLLLLATIMFIVLIPIGGLQWLASAGDEEKSSKARRLLLNAVVGLFLTLAAEGIGNIVLRQFGVNFSFRETITAISNGGPAGSSSTGSTPAGTRQVTFLLVANVSNSGAQSPAKQLSLAFYNGSAYVGGITTDAKGNGPITTWNLPIDAVTLNVYVQGSPPRTDTKVGELTVPANLTSAGCLATVVDTSKGVMQLTINIHPLLPDSTNPNGQLTVTISGGPEQTNQPFTVTPGPSGVSVTASLHGSTTYSFSAVDAKTGAPHARGSFNTPPFSQRPAPIDVQ